MTDKTKPNQFIGEFSEIVVRRSNLVLVHINDYYLPQVLQLEVLLPRQRTRDHHDDNTLLLYCYMYLNNGFTRWLTPTNELWTPIIYGMGALEQLNNDIFTIVRKWQQKKCGVTMETESKLTCSIPAGQLGGLEYTSAARTSDRGRHWTRWHSSSNAPTLNWWREFAVRVTYCNDNQNVIE